LFFEKFKTQKKVTELHNEKMEKALKDYNENIEKALKELNENLEINEPTHNQKIQENDKIISKNINNIEYLKNQLNQYKEKYNEQKEKINSLIMINFSKEEDINDLLYDLKISYSDLVFILNSKKGMLKYK